MPDQDLTEIIAIIDRSGSMDRIREDMIGGFNRFIREQAALPGKCAVTLARFNDTYEVVHESMPIGLVPPLELEPQGGTALLDAVGRAIDEAGERFSKLPEELRPSRIVVVIVTDGCENRSILFKREQIKQKIDHQAKWYRWQFVYVGAHADAFAEAGGIGISHLGTTRAAATGKSMAAAYAALSDSTRDYRSGISASVKMPSRIDADGKVEAP